MSFFFTFSFDEGSNNHVAMRLNYKTDAGHEFTLNGMKRQFPGPPTEDQLTAFKVGARAALGMWLENKS